MTRLAFVNPRFPALDVPAGAPLALSLDVRNSPVLFGCRTGLCGTCLAHLEGRVEPPGPEELEMLQLLAPGQGKARLLCQVRPLGDLLIREMDP
jgi:ferredoxin